MLTDPEVLSATQSKAPLSESEAQAIAHEAWIFGLPLVEHFKIFSLYRSRISPVYREWNAFFHVRNLMRPETRAVVSPNADSLMSSVLIDLREQPVVIEIPQLLGRYFSLQLVDILTNSFAYAGTRATGDDAVVLVLLPPKYDQDLPKALDGAKVISSPSKLVLGLGRMAAAGRADTLQARTLQNQLRITAMPQYLNSEIKPNANPIDWPNYFDVKHQTTAEFFQYLNFMLQWHEFTPNDQARLKCFEQIGIKAGRQFDPTRFPAQIQAGLNAGIQSARAKIERLAEKPGRQLNGWCLPDPKLGDFGNNEPLRAVTAWSFLYANILDEAIYVRAYVDDKNRVLNAKTKAYQIRFSAEQIPTCQFFWSITMYDGEDYFLVENELKRYALGDRSELRYDDDGGLTLYLRHKSPGPELESNWLPAPSGPFYLALRIYGNSTIPRCLPPVRCVERTS